jgi:hypothetical protein
MVEMRWVPPKLANSTNSECVVTEDRSLKVLQYRQCTLGPFGMFGPWSEWIDVPTVKEG